MQLEKKNWRFFYLKQTKNPYTLLQYKQSFIQASFFFSILLLLCHFPVDPSIWRGCTSFTSQLRRVEKVTWTTWIKSVVFKLKNNSLDSDILLRSCWFVLFPFQHFNLKNYLFICLYKMKTINITKNTIKATSFSINTKEKTKANIVQPLLHPGGHSALRGCKDDYWKRIFVNTAMSPMRTVNSMRTDVKTGTLPDYISHHAPQWVILPTQLFGCLY